MALKEMIKLLGQGKEDPLFIVKTKAGVKVLTSFKARSFLKMVVLSLGLDSKHYTFHAFRRSGVSLAFNSMVVGRVKQFGYILIQPLRQHLWFQLLFNVYSSTPSLVFGFRVYSKYFLNLFSQDEL